MSKKIKFAIVILLLVIAISIPSIFAYMIRQNEVSNGFNEAIATAQVNENFDGIHKTAISVKNTGNVPVVIRIRIVDHWLDSKGDIVGRNSDVHSMTYEIINNAITNKNDVKFSENAWLSSDWVNIGEYYYYKYPVYPTGDNNETSNLLKDGYLFELQTDTVEKNKIPFTYNQAIEIHAEAIQAMPVEAVINAWGVSIEDGSVTIPDNNN